MSQRKPSFRDAMATVSKMANIIHLNKRLKVRIVLCKLRYKLYGFLVVCIHGTIRATAFFIPAYTNSFPLFRAISPLHPNGILNRLLRYLIAFIRQSRTHMRITLHRTLGRTSKPQQVNARANNCD